MTENEVDRLIEAARKRGRNGPRDVAAILLAYRHGLRALSGAVGSNNRKDCGGGRILINKPIHLVLGGTHLLPATNDQISSIAASLHDKWSVQYIAPVHCTGEIAFAILKETFGDRYVYAGLGTTVLLGPKVTVKAEAGQPNKMAMDEEDLRSYRAALMLGPFRPFLGGGGHSLHERNTDRLATSQFERKSPLLIDLDVP